MRSVCCRARGEPDTALGASAHSRGLRSPGCGAAFRDVGVAGPDQGGVDGARSTTRFGHASIWFAGFADRRCGAFDRGGCSVDLAGARFRDVSLAGAHFDDINFAGADITARCNFRGMRIGGVLVDELFAAYRRVKAGDGEQG